VDGLWNWLEVGADYQAAPAGQQTLLGNAKVLLLHQPRHMPDGFVLNLAYTVHLKGGKQQGGASDKNPVPGGASK
jgi:hypothetical protein